MVDIEAPGAGTAPVTLDHWNQPDVRKVELGFQTRPWDNTSQLLQQEIGYEEMDAADRFSRDIDSRRVAGSGYNGYLAGQIAGAQAPNGELRIVFKVLKADGGTLKATLYSIDQPSPGFPASTVAIQGLNVKITIPGIGGTYEGKLDAEAITLTGKWTQGGMPFPLTLAHVKDDAAWEIPKPPPKGIKSMT